MVWHRRAGAIATFALVLCGACSNVSKGGVVLFDKTYTLETYATNKDGITSPDGLAWHDNKLLVADEGGSAIRRLGAAGWETLADYKSGIKSPEDIAVSATGQIFFTDDSANGVWAVTPAGARRLAWPGMSDAPTEGIALSRDGRVYAGETRRRRVGIYSLQTGDHERYPWKITKPESIAVDRTGHLFIADNVDDVIYRVDAAGNRRERLVWPEVSPESLAMVGDSLWFTDTDNGKVYRLTPGKPLETVAVFAGELQNVSGITGDGRGNVYISIQSDLKGGRGSIVLLRRRAR